MARKLHFDYETRSACDLRSCGQYIYAAHPTTVVLCCSWAIDDEPVSTWYPINGDPIPPAFEEALLDPETELCCHNVGFERTMSLFAPVRQRAAFMVNRPYQALYSKEVLDAIRPLSRWNCTAARAAYMGLPRSLEKAAMALGLSTKKDMEGSKLMMKMCKPRAVKMDGSYTWWEGPGMMERLGAYCEVDVDVERAIDNTIPDLSPFEKEVWIATEAMNDRGISVDRKLLDAMQLFVVDAEAEVNRNLVQRTNGRVSSAKNHAAVRGWLTDQGFPDVDDDGVKIGIGKAVVNAMLESDDLPDYIREVLVLRQDGGKSSTAKYKNIANRTHPDSRTRGSLVYSGAAATHRWSSRGFQIQNLARGGKVKTIDQALEDILNGASLEQVRADHGAPMLVASELIRPTFQADPNFWLARGDYAQIELRMNAWLSGEERTLDAFRRFDTITGYGEDGKPMRAGPDIYTVAAADIAGCSVEELKARMKEAGNDLLRQTGKVAELALGFHGGVGSLASMAKIYNVHIAEDKAPQVVEAWRESHPNIMQMGRSLLSAMMECVGSPVGSGKFYPLRQSRDNAWRFDGEPIRTDMWIQRSRRAMVFRLPSGNCLFYWYPKIEQMERFGKMRDTLTFMYEEKGRFARASMWPGLAIQNPTQSAARDVMAQAMVALHAAPDIHPVLTVHDEGVCEVSRRRYPTKEGAMEAVRAIMATCPSWATGLPIAVDASAGPRYVKG